MDSRSPPFFSDGNPSRGFPPNPPPIGSEWALRRGNSCAPEVRKSPPGDRCRGQPVRDRGVGTGASHTHTHTPPARRRIGAGRPPHRRGEDGEGQTAMPPTRRDPEAERLHRRDTQPGRLLSGGGFDDGVCVCDVCACV